MKLKIILSAILAGYCWSQAQVKVGIIGLDTSHSIAFTKELNADDKKEEYKDYQVVARIRTDPKRSSRASTVFPGTSSR